jgi:ankyrin repeat protein
MSDQAASPAAFVAALNAGDPEVVAALIARGANVRYRDEHGYDALLNAVHGRDISRDGRLLELLRLLVAAGAEPNGLTSYEESALRVLSHFGRFDAVALLLEAGADRSLLGWTPLIEAVALGSLADVAACLDAGAAPDEVDWWERTAFLVALLAGDVAKAELLAARGANVNARGRCAAPPLFYAINGHHPEAVRWLLAAGHDVGVTDEFGYTPLIRAVQSDDLACVEVLLGAGADVSHDANGTALNHSGSRAIALCLLDAGADPQDLDPGARRALVGLPSEPDPTLVTATPDEFRRAATRRFGGTNPERMNEPFWDSMIRSGLNAYGARKMFVGESKLRPPPVWCAQRFGQSLTFLADGRVVQIGGEHEDWYDPDFCIYNDVFVHGLDGAIAVYGYPEADFPPTDFHTATLVGDHIYVVGSLGYQGTRRFGETPVYRLDLRTFRIEGLAVSGEAPGWISRHQAALDAAAAEIRVFGGKIAVLGADGKEAYADNRDAFVLDLRQLRWRPALR